MLPGTILPYNKITVGDLDNVKTGLKSTQNSVLERWLHILFTYLSAISINIAHSKSLVFLKLTREQKHM